MVNLNLTIAAEFASLRFDHDTIGKLRIKLKQAASISKEKEGTISYESGGCPYFM
jgi:hypothetical protein